MRERGNNETQWSVLSEMTEADKKRLQTATMIDNNRTVHYKICLPLLG